MAEASTHVANIQGHFFVLYTYISPTGCAHCHTSMWRYGNEVIKCKQLQGGVCHRWSLQKIGYKCRECSVDVHLGCAQDFQSPCEHGHFMKNVRKSLVKRTRTRSIDDYAQIVRPTAGYNLEDGLAGILQGTQELTSPATLEDTAWFSIYFSVGDHDHFVMSDKKHRFDPFMISIMRELAPEPPAESMDGEESDDALQDLQAGGERDKKDKKDKKEKKVQKKKEQEEFDTLYRVIVWRKNGKEQWTLPVRRSELLSGAEIAAIVLPEKKGTLKMMDKSSPLFGTLAKELTMMEWEEYTNEYKFGVIYMQKGQASDSEFFSNETGSPAFFEFMDIVGQKVPLKGYQGYKGGLDGENGASGEFTYVAEYQGNKIMYHVSPLLPYSSSDPQQIKRKRHIGNDVCCVVFQDIPGCCFSPRAMKSQLLHCFIAVSLDIGPKGEKRYRVNVTSRDTVPPFGPALPDPPIFTKPQELREFLLQKLVNAERSALFSESFQQKKDRALGAHLSYIHARYSGESTGKKNVLNQKIGAEKKSTKILALDLPFSNLFVRSKSERRLYQQDSSSASSLPAPTGTTSSKPRFFEAASLKIKRPSILGFDSISPGSSSDAVRKPRTALKRRGSAPALFISNPELFSKGGPVLEEEEEKTV